MPKRPHSDSQDGHSAEVSSKRVKGKQSDHSTISSAFDDILASHPKAIDSFASETGHGGAADRTTLFFKALYEEAKARCKDGKAPGRLSSPSEQERATREAAEASESGALPAPMTTSPHVLPVLGTLTAWTPDDIATTLPPLPAISNKVVEKMALTHVGKLEHRSDISYENLEFVGDAFIYHVASEYITQTFPTLAPGPCSQLRERILKNAALAEYTAHYGIDTMANLPGELKGGRVGGTTASKQAQVKVHGDLFEAYVGGLIRSDAQGVETAQKWLKALWAKTLEKDIRDEYRRREQADTGSKDKSAKMLLDQLIGCKAVKIRYEDAPVAENGKVKKEKHSKLPLFSICVWVDGWGRSECLGYGSALSKKDAGAKAAKQMMENKKAMKFYIERKKAFLAERRAEAEAAKVAHGDVS